MYKRKKENKCSIFKNALLGLSVSHLPKCPKNSDKNM